MTDQELQTLVETVSQQFFGLPFRHTARFNARLRTTGGRYLLKSHDIEINPLHLQEHGLDELLGIIKHELCHYHLHRQGRGYKHADQEFKELLTQVGGTRYCQRVGGGRTSLAYRYQLVCQACGKSYKRKRRIDPKRYACGVCRGSLRLVELAAEQNR